MSNVTETAGFGKYFKEVATECFIQQVFLIYPAILTVTMDKNAVFKSSTHLLGCVAKKSVDYVLPDSYIEKLSLAAFGGVVTLYTRKFFFGYTSVISANDVASVFRAVEYDKVTVDKESFSSHYGAVYVEIAHLFVLFALSKLGVRGDHVPGSLFSVLTNGLVDGILVESVFRSVFKPMKALYKSGVGDYCELAHKQSFEHSQRTVTNPYYQDMTGLTNLEVDEV